MFAKKQSIKSIKLGKRMLDPLHLTSLILIETEIQALISVLQH